MMNTTCHTDYVIDGSELYLQVSAGENWRQCDNEALEMLEECAQLLAGALDRKAYERVESAAKQYDFDTALEALVGGARAAGYAIS